MGLDDSELERMADELYKDRTIRGTLYCGNCGYNLHSLPYVYTCPECGNSYNARPTVRRGIFSPQNMYVPLSDIVLALLSGVIAVVLIGRGVKPTSLSHLLLGVSFGLIALVLTIRSYRGLVQYFKSRAIARRVLAEEE